MYDVRQARRRTIVKFEEAKIHLRVGEEATTTTAVLLIHWLGLFAR